MIDREKILRFYKERFNKDPEPIRWFEWKRACEIADMFDVLFSQNGDVNYKAIESIEYAMDTTIIEKHSEVLKNKINE